MSLNFLDLFYYSFESYISFIVVCSFLLFLYGSTFSGFYSYSLMTKYLNFNITLLYCFFMFMLLKISYSFLDIKYFFFFFNLYNDLFIYVLKFFLILMTFLLLIFFYLYSQKEQILFSFEIYILLFISLLSMCLLISSTELILLYLSLEMQSLAFYILASSKQTSILSIEAGLKYFVLGTIASGFLLLGSSVIYGWTGLSKLFEINLFFFYLLDEKYMFIFFIAFIIPFFFKFSIAPFHIWTPDVYEGSPSVITFFFSLVPKFIILGLLIRFFYDLFLLNFFNNNWKFMFFFSSILSVIVGSLSGIFQFKIKRVLAYSSIINVGFFLSSIFNLNAEGFISSIFYFFVYFISTSAVFIVFLTIRYYSNFFKFKNIYEYGSIVNVNLFVVFVFIINLFSLIGLPPLSGFFGKFFILFSVFSEKYFVLFFFLIVGSVLSTLFYLRIIRILLFKRFLNTPLLMPISLTESYFLVFSLLFHLFNLLFLNSIFEGLYILYIKSFNYI